MSISFKQALFIAQKYACIPIGAFIEISQPVATLFLFLTIYNKEHQLIEEFYINENGERVK